MDFKHQLSVFLPQIPLPGNERSEESVVADERQRESSWERRTISGRLVPSWMTLVFVTSTQQRDVFPARNFALACKLGSAPGGVSETPPDERV